MGFDLGSLSPILDLVVDQAQSKFVDEDKELLNALIDAGQVLIRLALDGVDNEAQGLVLATKIADAIAEYDGSVPSSD